MSYRNLSQEQFQVIKDATTKVCEVAELKTIRDFKRVGNELIDEIENGRLTFGDLLQSKIDYIPKFI